MTIDILFLLLVPTYLVMIAYGQLGTRRRGLPARARYIAGAVRVALPPVAVIGVLLWEGDPAFAHTWIPVAIGMAVAGAAVAAIVELVAPKIGA